MSTHAVLQAAAIAGYLFILGLVYGRWRLTAVHKAFLLFLWSALGWAVVTFLLALPLSEGHEVLGKRLAAVFWIPLNFWVLRFTYVMLERPRGPLYYVLGTLTGLSLAVYLGTDLALSGFERFDWGVAALRGPLHLPIALVTAACALIALGFMVQGLHGARSPAKRKPLVLMILGSALAILAAFGANLVLPVFVGLRGFPELGSYAVFLISPFLYLAVTRYDFLRIGVSHVAEDLFENTPDGVVLADATGRVTRFNSAASRLLDLRGDIVGHPVDEILPALERAESGGQLVGVGSGDQRRVLHVTRTPKVRLGSELGEVLVLRDVSAEKRAEEVLRKSRDQLQLQVKQRTEELEQAQRMEAIGTIAGGFAHDFNNILAAIVGFATASKSDLPDNHRVQGDLDEILVAANRGRGIVRQLMTFTRRRAPHRSFIDGFRTVEEVVKLVEVSAPANVTVGFVGRASHAVRADPAQVHQVLLNMATNAFQAMAPGGGTLTVEVDVVQLEEPLATESFQRLPSGKYLKISVQDDGPGMRPEVVRRAFEPFFTTKGPDQGTGLGLATARRIVKEHGGAITLETAEGEGCKASVLLPCATGTVQPERQGDQGEPTGTERIWVVDDAAQVTRAVRRMLEPLGYRVRTFTDPREALDAYREQSGSVDLVITDLVMPHIGGVALARAMLELRPDLPVMLVTGHAPGEQRDVAEQVGIRTFLFKPLERSMLATAVRHQLDSPPPSRRISVPPASRDVA